MQVRNRTCLNPHPESGLTCDGNEEDVLMCNTQVAKIRLKYFGKSRFLLLECSSV